jgi:site-specific DNA-methyltransferase (adenine-specific)
MITVYQGDNLSLLKSFKDEEFSLIYIDPPFNTGVKQKRSTIKTVSDKDGDRVGYGGRKYKTVKSDVVNEYDDKFGYDEYIDFISKRLVEAKRILKSNGSIFVHLDYREVHYVKVLCDEIFGRESFINEIVWAYDYGARSTSRWSVKHNNILWYAKDPNDYCFNYDEVERIPYMAPSLVGAEKAERGKTLTDTWWHTIVSPNSKEKTGYPTQKPLGVINRIVKVHSKPGDKLLDFFAGSGTLGESAELHSRDSVLIDQNPQAIEVMKTRFKNYNYRLMIEGQTENE